MTTSDARLRTLPWVFALASLSWADAAITLFALQYAGSVEVNPFANLIIAQMGLWSLLIPKAIVTGLLFGVVLLLKPSRLLAWSVKGLVLAYTLGMAWNIIQVV